MKPCITQQCSFHEIGTDSGCGSFYFTRNCVNYTTMKGEDMKRYKLLGMVLTGLGKSDEIKPSQMFEDPNGEWMKWEDIKGILQYKDQLKGYKWEVCTCDMSPCICGKAIGAFPKCNCKEQAYRPDYEDHPDGLSPLPILLPPFWICPVHGYKKR